jgi:hypothetical protein
LGFGLGRETVVGQGVCEQTDGHSMGCDRLK